MTERSGCPEHRAKSGCGSAEKWLSVVDSTAQEGGDVAGTLRHRHDPDGPTFGAADDEVRADRPEQNRV